MKKQNLEKRLLRIALLLLTLCLVTGCGGQTPQDEIKAPDEKPPTVSLSILDLEQDYWSCAKLDSLSDEVQIRCDASTVTLGSKSAAQYPQLASVLQETADRNAAGVDEDFDIFLSELEAGRADRPYVSTVDLQVRRADSIVFSMVCDSYRDCGNIYGFRGMQGVTYDTETGSLLTLGDIICDMDGMVQAVEKELNSHTWSGEFLSETAVTDYFVNTPWDGISWTLDYNGITFYFSPGDLAEEGFGRQSATVTFKEYPDVFQAKYTAAPDVYTVRLPLDHPAFIDLDGDGRLDEVSVSGFYNEELRAYDSFGIYTDKDGMHYYEERLAEGLEPYLVKTEGGEVFIYVMFCSRSSAEPAPPANPKMGIYRIESGRIINEGVMSAEKYFYSKDWMPEEITIVKTAEELVEAVKPGAEILLQTGRLNLSDYLAEQWAQQGDAWNAAHPHVKLEECFDGVEAVIEDVDGLVLCGGGFMEDNPQDNEIVTDPRYAAVFRFRNCRNITLSDLTMGHTELGECSGNVLDFERCRDVKLFNMDLYGCGVYAVQAVDGSGDFTVNQTMLRDCSCGPLYIEGCEGFFNFEDCVLTGSESYAYFDGSSQTQLYFHRCSFGSRETEYFSFMDEVTAVDCSWSENIEVYPDMG